MVMFPKILFCHRKHPSCTCGRIVKRADNSRFRKSIIIGRKKDIHHQSNNFPRSEMLSGRFIGGFRKPPDEFLEDEPHVLVGNLVGVKIDRGEFLNDHEKKVLAVQVGDLFSESEPFEDVPGILGKARSN